MSVVALLRDLHARGVQVRVDGERLVAHAPPGALTPELADRVREKKEELIEFLRTARVERRAGGSMRGLADGKAIALTPAQRRYWDLQQLDPESTAYVGPGAFRLEGPLDRSALRSALQWIVDRHDILRYRFSHGAGGPRVEVAPEVEVRLEADDLSHVPASERESVLRRYLEDAAEEPLDLEAGPPVRFRLIRLAPEEHALLLLTHSTIWDGWSFDLFLAELKANYEAAVEGAGVSPLPPLSVQYADYAAWLDQRLESGALAPDLDYWSRALRGDIPRLALPADRARALGPDYHGDRVETRIRGDLLDAMRRLARSEEASLYMVLLAALNALLHRYTGLEDILVSSPLQGRGNPETEDIIGLFTNTLFFRNRVDPEQSFRALLKEVKATALEAVDHQDVPAEVVVEAKEASGTVWDPYGVVFVYQQAAARPARMGPVSIRSIIRGTRHVQVDLLVWCREHEDYLDGGFDYRTSLFDRGRMERMVGHLEALLDHATRQPDEKVGDLEILSADERISIEGWSAARPEGDASAQLPAEGAAIVCGSLRLEGDDMDAAVHGVAASILMALDEPTGVDASEAPLYGVVVDGSAESVLAVLAGRALGAEVLLVPADANPSAVAGPWDAVRAVPLFAAKGFTWPGAASRPVVHSLDALAASPGPVPAWRKGAGGVRTFTPGAPSGADGRRPWREVEAAAARLGAHLVPEAGASGVAVYADGPVEATVDAMLATLAAGATLILPEPDLPVDGWELDEAIAAGEVRGIVAGGTAIQELTATGWERAVDRVLCCDPFVSEALVSSLPPATNLELGYGAPGVGGWALVGSMEDHAVAPAASFQALARATRVRVVDGRGAPRPIGVPGQLLLGSETDRSVPGVAASWTAAGRLRLSTPADGVAIMAGRPVALAALCDALLEVAQVRDAHVVPTAIEGERLLAVHLVTTGEADAEAVRERLQRAGLPARAAITVHVHEELPRTAAGGLDERALDRRVRERGRGVTLEGDAELAMAAVWQEALGLDSVGPLDNFFELGGHSLLAAQVASRVTREFGLKLDPRALFFQNLRQVAAGTVPASSTAGAPAS